MGMGPCVLASGSNQVLASISVIKKGTSLHPSHEPVLTSTKAPSSSLFPQKVGRAKKTGDRLIRFNVENGCLNVTATPPMQ